MGFGRHFIRVWSFIGIFSTLVGLAGLPDDLETWYLWVNGVMENAKALAWAEIAVTVAEFINQPIVRIALAIIGLSLVFWQARWFWRIRHRVWIAGRKMVQKRVWLSHEEAMEVLKQSDWAIQRLPHITERKPLFSAAAIADALYGGAKATTVYGISEAEKAKRRYLLFLEAALWSFADTNSQAVRITDGQIEYDNADLDTFLAKALQADLEEEFGAVPKIQLKSS